MGTNKSFERYYFELFFLNSGEIHETRAKIIVFPYKHDF